MKVAIVSLFVACLLLGEGSALVLKNNGKTPRDGIETRSAETCGDPNHAVRLLRAVLPSDDHFYTTDATEMQNAVTFLGYRLEGTAARVFTTQELSTVPLYRLANTKNPDHFYTTSSVESDNAIIHLGYRSEGIAAYVYPAAICGGVPLYRLSNGGIVDHFYTTSEAERDNAQESLGYQNEGIAAYVLPA